MSTSKHTKEKHSVSHSMPLTTEEPVRRHWLSDQLKDINELDSAESPEDDTHVTETNKTGMGIHKQHPNTDQLHTKSLNINVPIVITPALSTDPTYHSNSDNNNNEDEGNEDDDRQTDSDDDDSPDTDMENEITDSEENSGEEPTVVTPPTTPSTPSANTPRTTELSSSSSSTTATNTPTSVDDQVQKQVPLPNLRHGSTQMDLLWNEMEQLQYNNGDNEYASDASDASDDESDMDDELRRITESNRHIYLPDATSTKPTTIERSKSINDPNLRNLLVFADTHVVTQRTNGKVVSTIYGAGPQGNLVRSGTTDIQLRRRKGTTVGGGGDDDEEDDENEQVDDDQYNRHYLIACDFSHESLHAMEWAMGTMLRDHDVLHIVTVANREDNPELVNQSNGSVENDLDASLNAVIGEAKKRLSRMMLYDIKLVFYSMIGRVKDVLKHLIRTLPLTMVVCGSRGRGTMKGLLMGSVSTYLVHKSLVPVAVIRPKKKKKKEHRHIITATPLSESVKTGQLHVDELG